MPGTLGKRNADLAVPEGSPGKLARVAAADALARGPAPTSVEVDGKQCLHEVVWPGDWDGPAPTHPPKRKEGPAAREFSFTLDPFQQVAVNCLEEGHSVLVAAHTSAGKTAVAEYAFAMGLRDKQRIIYTSPLKALSNQKYRQMYEEFQDVGLMTGDVTINSEASCLVMTTEILRSMLINGSEVIREAAWIVFDEVHYLRDKERGVVWEQAIVLTPPSVNFVFLSATLPNAREFASWIAKIHRGPCHVVTTNYRPTPLQHYMFPVGGDGLQMVVDEASNFREDSFQRVMAALQEAKGSRKDTGKGQQQGAPGSEEDSDIYKIIRMIMQREFDPVIVFSFSKKECESLALQMVGMDLTSEDEKKLIEGVFSSAKDLLAEADARLPQIAQMLPMLKRGIGVHHSGLLPLLKEVVEILFQEGLLKALFATETFSTGLNMPARTVVFTHTRKYDGGTFRWLTPGEYIQMSGRAGRRGIDDRGMVVLMADARMEPAVAKDMLQGQPDALRSEFHLSYAMILGLARGQAVLDIEALLAASFRQSQAQNELPALRQRIAALQAQAEAVNIQQQEAVEGFQAVLATGSLLRSRIRSFIHAPDKALPFLQEGRLVQLLAASHPSSDAEAGTASGEATVQLEEPCVWGAVVAYRKQAPKGSRQPRVVVDVLVNCTHASIAPSGPRRRPELVAAAAEGAALVCALPLEEVAAFSSLRINLSQDLRGANQRRANLQMVAEVERRFSEGVPLLDPAKDMGIKDSDFRKAIRKLESVERLRDKHELASSAQLGMLLQNLRKKQGLQESARLAAREAAAAEGTVLMPELKARRRVLHRLGYMDEQGLVSVKGQVAAHIQSADELVLSELIFQGAFKDMVGGGQGKPTADVVAMLSCFVWQEMSEQPPALPIRLAQAHREIQESAGKVGRVAAEAKLGVDVNEFVQLFRPEVMQLFHEWALGAPFSKVLKMSDYFEGSIVRAVRRTEELLRQLIEGANVIGDAQLAQQFGACIDAIKRDIVFAASLYL